MLRRWGWVLVLCSCFGDPPTASGSTDDPDPPCTPGLRLCPCDAGSCDQGLICAPSVDRCVSEDCDVGELGCPCGDAMQCEGELACVDKLCADPQDMNPSTSTSSGTSATTTPATSDPSGSPTDTGTTSVAETTDTPVTSGEAGSSAADTGPGCVGAGGLCSDCFMCAMAEDGPCAAEAAACSMMAMAVPPCYSIYYGWPMCEVSHCSCPDPTDADGTALVNCLVDQCGSLDCYCF